jgi:hypothetical protein
MNKFFRSLRSGSFRIPRFAFHIVTAILAIAILAVLFAPPAARAQQPTVYTVGNYNGGTNNFAPSTTNATTYTIATSDFDAVGIQLSAVQWGTQTNTTLITRWKKSADSSNYETTPSVVVLLTAAGSTNITSFTDVSIPSVASLQLASVENTNLAVAYFTNVTIKARFKAATKRNR